MCICVYACMCVRVRVWLSRVNTQTYLLVLTRTQTNARAHKHVRRQTRARARPHMRARDVDDEHRKLNASDDTGVDFMEVEVGRSDNAVGDWQQRADAERIVGNIFATTNDNPERMEATPKRVISHPAISNSIGDVTANI